MPPSSSPNPAVSTTARCGVQPLQLQLHAERVTLLDAALLAAILVLMLWGIGNHGLYEPHEGHFAGVGREMVTRGDWITPYLDGAPYLNKPPLLYWIIALSYTLFGQIGTWAARVPLALIGWSGVVLAWAWARKLFGSAAGRCAAVMLAVSVGWYLFCHQLMIDALLSVLLLASSYALWLAANVPEKRWRWIAFYACCGLGVLAKGPIGLAFPLLALLGFAAWRGRWDLLRPSRHMAGIAVLLLIAAPWCVLLEIKNPGALKYMLVNENLNRIIDRRWPPDYSVVKVGPLAYILVALVWMAPWSLILPQTLSFTFKQARAGERRKDSAPAADALLILALTWMIPILVFLPMPSRLVYYCISAVPPFAVMAAGWWVHSREDCHKQGRAAAGWTLLAAGAAVFASSFWMPDELRRIPLVRSMPAMLVYIEHLCYALSAALAAGGVFLLLRQPLRGIAALGALLAATQLSSISGFAEFDEVWSSRKTVAELHALAGEDVIWVTEGSKEIGAAAGIAYFLGQDKNGRARSVLVMEDTPGREPPKFPGPKANYLIDQRKLGELWVGTRPVVYLTDFQRTDWEHDPPALPPAPAKSIHELRLPRTGNRKIFVNDPAWKRWQKQSSKASGV